ncbi:MAG: uroporphyrinogen-III synthase [Acidimicrobiales bacterium]|nr:uroporphyrinogen-III synthase [Acidimicrobiales bacterium]
MPPVLSGFTIGITGDRRADEQAELLRRRGATVVHGPMIETRPLADSPELRSACEAILARPPDLLVATTGVGIRSWMEAADGLGLGDRMRRVLADVETLARSPKAAGALLTADLRLDWQAPGERTQDVLDHLAGRDLTGVRVAVQRDGADDPVLADALAGRGADVVDVPIYRWILPSDPAPAHRLLDALVDRQLDAITVTSSPALANLLTLADRRPDAEAIRSALATEVLVACVGPVCSASAARIGVTRVVQPDRFRLGSMVKRLADALAATAWELVVDGAHLAVQGALATVDGQEVVLTRREQLLLARLADARGAVVTKAELGRSGWGPGTHLHVVEVTVGRLRARLGAASGAVVTVPRRGYRLAACP